MVSIENLLLIRHSLLYEDQIALHGDTNRQHILVALSFLLLLLFTFLPVCATLTRKPMKIAEGGDGENDGENNDEALV